LLDHALHRLRAARRATLGTPALKGEAARAKTAALRAAAVANLYREVRVSSQATTHERQREVYDLAMLGGA